MLRNNQQTKVDQQTNEENGHSTHKKCEKHYGDYGRQRSLSRVGGQDCLGLPQHLGKLDRISEDC